MKTFLAVMAAIAVCLALVVMLAMKIEERIEEYRKAKAGTSNVGGETNVSGGSSATTGGSPVPPMNQRLEQEFVFGVMVGKAIGLEIAANTNLHTVTVQQAIEFAKRFRASRGHQVDGVFVWTNANF